jgi:prepilin-type N-terminal cleavage/methylation domain-containing protein
VAQPLLNPKASLDTVSKQTPNPLITPINHFLGGNNMLRKLTNNKKGFTLIELMIVIAIIGILAAIAIPNFISYRNKSYCSQAESDARGVAAAISDFYSDPNNTRLVTTADLSGFEAKNGIAAVTIAGNPNTTMTVTVSDTTGRCPRGTTYQLSLPADTANDGW